MMTYMDLSQEQQLFVSAALKGHSILVDACIGSGKTTAIQVLCNMFSRDTMVLYLTYNKLLKLDAKSRIRMQNVDVTNYHGFAFRELVRSGRATSMEDCVRDYNLAVPDTARYDVLIIDEYQDIDQEISDLLRHVKECNPGMQIIVVGDMAQRIYDKTRLGAAMFIDRFLPRGYLRLEFTQCFRISEEHARMLGEIWGKNIRGVNPDCRISEMEFNEAFDFLAGREPGEILCLGSNNGLRSKMLNELETHYPEKFNKFTVWAKINRGEGGGATDPRPGVAIFTTYDGCKGMERDVCVIFDWDEGYWSSRIHKPEANYEILRNVFCVAASRGKRHIVFVKTRNPLSKETLMDDSVQQGAFQNMSISSMFDFKYAEDVDMAYRALDIREIQPKGEAINVSTKDALIDLSPCIGIYQEAVYFSGYDIDRDIRLYFELNKDRDFQKLDGYEDWTLEQKVLYLTALETGQNRYWQQVRLPLVKDSQRDAIMERLGSRLSRDVAVQGRCVVPFYKKNKLAFEAVGFFDAMLDNVVYELKFVSSLSHVHFLQCAMYIVAREIPSGILWNVRTNQMFEITIPDRKVFLDRVVRAATKGRIGRYSGAEPARDGKPADNSGGRPMPRTRVKPDGKAKTDARRGSVRDRVISFCSKNADVSTEVIRKVMKKESDGGTCGPTAIEGLYFDYGLKIPVQRQAFAKYFREYMDIVLSMSGG